jgi:hypothetical protein
MNEDALLSERQYFSRLALWPHQPSEINPRGWLDNFADGRDREIAVELLASFIYFNNTQTSKLVQSAFHSLSGLPMFEQDRSTSWKNYRKTVLVSYPSGNSRDAAASGRIFIRQARNNLVEDEAQLYDPEDLIRRLSTSPGPENVILIDDFSGTGDQVTQSWKRQYDIAGESQSLKSVAADGKIATIFYIPAVATARAVATISSEAPDLAVQAAHLLPGDYNIGSPQTSLVPEPMIADLDGFLRRYTIKAGHHPDEALGYGDCGLLLAFEHSTPDNTIPLVWSTDNQWTPLRRRI